MSRILLVRHGQIKPKADDRHFGHTDFPLDAFGIEQATRLRNKLVKESIKKIFTSDLIRTIRTAELATSGFGIPIIKCPELREIDFGSVEGMTYDDIIKDYPGTNQIWTGSDVNKKFPGGESLKDLGKRISSFMKRLDEDWW
ncbi:MAG: histidine phosphatase family protein [Chloroflexi bacterium]|nr:histidine phosphatase family protein [Chloroflexota bacterium]